LPSIEIRLKFLVGENKVPFRAYLHTVPPIAEKWNFIFFSWGGVVAQRGPLIVVPAYRAPECALELRKRLTWH